MGEELYTIASAIAAPKAGEEELLRLLCAAAEQELSAALREGVTPEDCREAFLCAAACLAAAGLLAGRETAAEQFSAGEVSIRTTSAGNREERLRAAARQLIAPYSISGEGFAFLEVVG